MIKGLSPVPLKELKTNSSSRTWIFEGYLEEFPSLIPIKGKLTADHQGSSLLIKGHFKTIINLSCDRCLKAYNEEILYNSEELIFIQDAFRKGNSRKGSKNLDKDNMESLVETILSSDSFNPSQWIFEQLNLQLPLLKICSRECKGPQIIDSKEKEINEEVDPRWSVLKKLK